MRPRVWPALVLLQCAAFASFSFAQQPLASSPGSPAPVAPLPAQNLQDTSDSTPYTSGTITAMSGTVQIRKVKAIFWRDARLEEQVITGDQVKTGKKGQVKIEIVNGNIIYLKADSLLVIDDLSHNDFIGKYNNIFSTNKARLKAEVKAKQNINKFEIRTPTAIAGVRGTTLYLNVEPLFTRLFVENGSAVVENPVSGKSVEVPPGLSTSSDNSGQVSEPAPPPPEQQQEFQASWEPVPEGTETAPAEDAPQQEAQAEQAAQTAEQDNAVLERQSSQEAEKTDYINSPNTPATETIVEDPDTDGDGLVNSADLDDDNDGLPDTWETAHGLNAQNADTDGDGLSDFFEVMVTPSASPTDMAYNAKHADSSGDGLGDAYKVTRMMNSSSTDSDNDGYPDTVEIARGTSPTSAYSFPGGVLHNKDLDSEPDNFDGANGNKIWDVTEGNTTRGKSTYTFVGHPGAHLDPAKIDTDGDGLSDYSEAWYGSDPFMNDTDGDGIIDGLEWNSNVSLRTDPRSGVNTPGYNPADTDGDGLSDSFEAMWGANAANPDSDGDGVPDAEELREGTNPLSNDTDGDGISDYNELHPAGNYSSEPLLRDSDKDGANDTVEVAAGKDPESPMSFPANITYDYDMDGIPDKYDKDSDNDGLSDAAEARLGTDPLKADTDNDGIPDGLEINLGLNPLSNDTDGNGILDGNETLPHGFFNTTVDSDHDGVPDYIENQMKRDNGALIMNANLSDSDGDGVPDGQEFQFYSSDGAFDPMISDTDGDGIPDGQEVNNSYHTCPYIADTDGDGLSDWYEINTTHSDPQLSDTDRDGLRDNLEALFLNTSATNNDTDGDTVHDADDAFPTNATLNDTMSPLRLTLYDSIRGNVTTNADVRGEIRDMLSDVQERDRDAIAERMSDAQTHKVLKDHTGAWVRVEEYVFRPTPKTVSLLNVCLHAGNSIPTVLEWKTVFNTNLNSLTSTELRSLPWDKYLSGSLALPIDYGTAAPAYYPESMSVKMGYSSNSLSESRGLDNMLTLSAGHYWQSILTDTLSVNGGAFNSFTVQAVTPSTLGPYTPASFTYQGGSTNPVFSVYAIDGAGGFATVTNTFNSIWDVLGTNLNGPAASNYIGSGKFIELSVTAGATYSLVYVPMDGLSWKTQFSWDGAKDTEPP